MVIPFLFRRVRGLAKTVCTTVELFWKRIERVVWEGEKRKLLRQLHEKKRKKLDRLVRQAMKKCKLLARGLRESVRNTEERKTIRRKERKRSKRVLVVAIVDMQRGRRDGASSEEEVVEEEELFLS